MEMKIYQIILIYLHHIARFTKIYNNKHPMLTKPNPMSETIGQRFKKIEATLDRMIDQLSELGKRMDQHHLKIMRMRGKYYKLH